MEGAEKIDRRGRRSVVAEAIQGKISRPEIERLLQSLAVSVAANDEEAAELLAILVYELPYVRRAVSSVLFNDEDVEEALQETVLAVVKSISKFRGESRYSTWIVSIARFKAINLLEERRRRTNLVTASQQEARSEVETFSSILAGRLDVNVLVDSLPPKLGEVVRLREIDQLSYEEIADQLGIKLYTVRSRLARGRARLEATIARPAQ